jgi:dTDP-4-amino-4,6-dideoxygalactose transaminase
MIKNLAKNKGVFKRSPYFTNTAREAWSLVIERYKALNPQLKLLLPSYIGWSPREGSGIFDSVLKSKVNFDFYTMSKDLHIDFEVLKNKLSKDKNQLVLLVHYFGFPDPKYSEITNWLLKNKIAFVEDCAHALYSDYIGGSCGRKGRFSFYSLHKMLPMETGGMYLSNSGESFNYNSDLFFPVMEYDLKSIYDIRRENYHKLQGLLKGIKGIKPLHPALPDGVCPQTFPVLVEKDRDLIYSEMNKNGFGLVSLYHTMISEITPEVYPDSHFIAKHITNLPLHQEVDSSQFEDMITLLKKYIGDD